MESAMERTLLMLQDEEVWEMKQTSAQRKRLTVFA